MSSGSNASRKPSVASTLFKASSRFLHGSTGNGQGAGGKSMKRQRAGASMDKEVLSAESNTPETALDDHKDSSGGAKSKKRFVGVRQRPSGRWVAEIKDTTQKIRLWLGTFDSAEEGAKAYDTAARALRGANTRTNFVPAMACESTVPASKATRLIRLRQIAAASKASEKEARNVIQSPELKDHLRKNQDESKDQVISPLVRQDFQHSSNPRTAVDDTPPHLPSSPPKPARLIGRRHNAPLTSAKAEQEDVAPNPTVNDRSAVDRDLKLEVGSFHSPDCFPQKLEPQQSSISENLSISKNRRLVASPQDSSLSLLPPSLPSCSIPPDCMQPSNLADGEVQLVNSGLSEVAVTSVKFSKQIYYSTQRAEEWHGSSPFESFSSLPIDNFVPQPLNPFLVAPLEASRQSFRSDHNMSDLVGCSHHDASSQQISCSTNRDHVSIYQSERYGDLDPEISNDNVILDRERRLRSISQQLNSDGAMTLDAAKCMRRTKCCEPLTSSAPKGKVDYENTEMYGTEAEKRPPEICDLREKGFLDLQVTDIPWQDWVLGDETDMESEFLGLDLSCETSGVYNSTFDFTETIDRDSCTSVMEDHLSDNSDFILRVDFENSPSTSNSFEKCVLLTQTSEVDYGMSSHESSLRGPPLSPPDTHPSTSSFWGVNETSTWDGQSSGSTETTTTTDLKKDGDGAGECTSHDPESLWSSMDLPAILMVR